MFIKLTSAFTLVFAFAFVLAPAGYARAARQRSTRDRVYSDAQAERGKVTYVTICTECHAEQLWGANWSGKTLADVFDTIKTFMPENNPGSLDAKQVTDILAYILQANSLPSGADDLPDTEEGLKAIKLEPAEK